MKLYLKEIGHIPSPSPVLKKKPLWFYTITFLSFDYQNVLVALLGWTQLDKIQYSLEVCTCRPD